MPRGDGTGPEGRGPATGRGLGGCVGTKTSGNQVSRPLRSRRFSSLVRRNKTRRSSK